MLRSASLCSRAWSTTELSENCDRRRSLSEHAHALPASEAKTLKCDADGNRRCTRAMDTVNLLRVLASTWLDWARGMRHVLHGHSMLAPEKSVDV